MKTTTLHNLYYIKLLFFIGILMSSVKINSQTVTTLLHTLKTTSNDSIRIETLIQLSNQYRVINQDTAIMYAKKALEIEKKIQMTYLITKYKVVLVILFLLKRS